MKNNKLDSANCVFSHLDYLTLKELNIPQTTIKNPVTFEGYGLHTANYSTVTLKPAPVNFGIKFQRTDLQSPDNIIPALGFYSANYNRNTSLLKDDISIMTIEHLMA